METMKTILKFTSLLGCIILASLVLSDFYVAKYTSYSSDKIDDVEEVNVGLLLGTSKYTSSGRLNYFYKYRVEAAIDLYESCKIREILVSGDNSSISYNEPIMIYKDLLQAGIPKEDIHLDYAGFRTFDSVIRAKKIFNQSKLLIISQRFHNERALFIARSNGIEATAFNTKTVSFGFAPKTFVREKLARVKAVLDVHLLGTKPRFLGKSEIIS